MISRFWCFWKESKLIYIWVWLVGSPLKLIAAQEESTESCSSCFGHTVSSNAVSPCPGSLMQISSSPETALMAEPLIGDSVSLKPVRLKGRPVCTDKGRNPRRFDMEENLPDTGDLIVCTSLLPQEPSSAIFLRLCSPGKVQGESSLAEGFLLRRERNSLLLEDPTTSLPGKGTSSLAFEFPLVERGETFGAARDILLAMFRRKPDEAECRSCKGASRRVLGTMSADSVGVVGDGIGRLQ